MGRVGSEPERVDHQALGPFEKGERGFWDRARVG
jgi:hypothetical protein